MPAAPAIRSGVRSGGWARLRRYADLVLGAVFGAAVGAERVEHCLGKPLIAGDLEAGAVVVGAERADPGILSAAHARVSLMRLALLDSHAAGRDRDRVAAALDRVVHRD